MTMANPSDELGYDTDIVDDMLPDGRPCSGSRLVANAIAHRLMEDNLPMIGAPGGYIAYGVNVRRWAGEVTSQKIADAKAPLLAVVIGRDTRVDPGSISVAVTIDKSGTVLSDASRAALRIEVNARDTKARPIALVFAVSSASVELLAQGT